MFKCSVRSQGGAGHSKSKGPKTRVTSNRPLMGKGTPILTIPKYKVPSKDTIKISSIFLLPVLSVPLVQLGFSGLRVLRFV